MPPIRHYKNTLILWRFLSVAFLVSLLFAFWNLVGYNFAEMPRSMIIAWLILSIIGFILTVFFLRFEEPSFWYWVLVLLGVVYVVLLFDVTWFSRSWTWYPTAESDMKRLYLETHVNFVPLDSIRLFYHGYVGGHVNLSIAVANIFGNILLLVPSAFFAPYFFPAFRKWYVYMPFAALLSALIESVQFIFMCGSVDIDDWILNTGGAWIVFLFLLFIRCWPRVEKLSSRPKKNPVQVVNVPEEGDAP